jgi:hypothetical protein
MRPTADRRRTEADNPAAVRRVNTPTTIKQRKIYEKLKILWFAKDRIHQAGGIPAASNGMKVAAVMFATVPILVVYPWIQRYFIAGVTIGAVKG